MAYVQLAMAVVSAVMSSAAAKKEGDAAKAQAEYAAGVARNNQIIAQQYADTERAKGRVAEDAKRQETAQKISAQRASGGSSGLDVNSGTSLDLQADTAKLGEFDALTIRNNAARAAYGYETQGVNYGSAAEMELSRGRYAKNASNIKIGQSIASSASSFAGKWDSMSNAGGGF